jgi:hypothetical protein
MPENYIDDHSDIAQFQQLSKVLQTGSKELTPGPNRLEGAAGDILAYFSDHPPILYPRVSGAPFVPVAFVELYVEWPAVRSSSAGPIAVHDFQPADVEWPIVNTSGRKACIRSSNGNKIERTIYMHALIGAEGLQTTFAFRSTALKPAKRFADDADRVRVQIDGEIVRVVGAQCLISSAPEKDGAYTWYQPTFARLGVLGEPNGPTLEIARKAKTLRFQIRAEDDARKRERLAAISAVIPTPPLLGVGQPPRGTTIFTTGVKWSDPKPSESQPAPDAKRVDPNDDIPWQ